jgi:hypothetical protein
MSRFREAKHYHEKIVEEMKKLARTTVYNEYLRGLLREKDEEVRQEEMKKAASRSTQQLEIMPTQQMATKLDAPVGAPTGPKTTKQKATLPAAPVSEPTAPKEKKQPVTAAQQAIDAVGVDRFPGLSGQARKEARKQFNRERRLAALGDATAENAEKKGGGGGDGNRDDGGEGGGEVGGDGGGGGGGVGGGDGVAALGC